MDFKDLVRNRRNEIGLTLEEVGNIVGVSKATVQRWESGEIENVRRDKIAKLAKALQCTPAYLMGWEEEDIDIFSIPGIEPMPEMEKKPLLGTIACGEPILADENIESYLDIPKHIKCDFCLRCKGNSMINARINDGDIVCIKQQPIVDNGEIAAVLIDNEATLKRFYRYGDTVVLRAENPTFKDLEYSNSQLDEIRIIGKATDFISSIK